MLTDYDAKAVAEVMGLAFLLSPAAAALPARSGKRSKPGSKAVATIRGHDFILRSGGATLRIVDTRPKPASGRSPPADRRGVRPPAAASRLVAPPTAVLIEQAVEQGLPRTALRHVAEWLADGDAAKVSALEWGVVPKTTLERRAIQLSPQESERTERVARLAVHACRALGSAAEARDFMTTPHPELDGRRPIDAARTDLGTRRTEQILNALEYGLAV